MKQLEILFIATNQFALILFTPIKKAFKRTVKIRNKKEKDMTATYEYTEPDKPRHYGAIKIVIKGKDVAIDKEEKILTDNLYKLLEEIQQSDPTLKRTILGKLKSLGLKTVSKFKDQLIKLYLSLGIVVEYRSKKVKGVFKK